MPYEIPAEIAYEEKIIFGLTFRQLVYCLVFGPVVLAILFKAPFDIYTGMTLNHYSAVETRISSGSPYARG
jgi:formate hydrogenlyase subunit 4